MKSKRNKLYTYWLKRAFKHFGTNSVIEYPLDLEGGEYVSVGSHTYVGKRLRLNAYNRYKEQCFTPVIEIGDNVNINQDCHIAAINKVSIGNGSLIASKVFISDHLHGRIELAELSTSPGNRKLYAKGEVIIGENVWIGENVAILSGVHVGNNCIIGANAVLTKDYPANCVIGGIPARIIKTIE